MIGLDSYSRQFFLLFGSHFYLYLSLTDKGCPLENSDCTDEKIDFKEYYLIFISYHSFSV